MFPSNKLIFPHNLPLFYRSLLTIPLGAALMQGKRYAVFSRFSVHTVRVTHLIKIFTFYRKYAILCTKANAKIPCFNPNKEV
jgi:hypothetical protein